jgi:hypothetical protein
MHRLEDDEEWMDEDDRCPSEIPTEELLPSTYRELRIIRDCVKSDLSSTKKANTALQALDTLEASWTCPLRFYIWELEELGDDRCPADIPITELEPSNYRDLRELRVFLTARAVEAQALESLEASVERAMASWVICAKIGFSPSF